MVDGVWQLTPKPRNNNTCRRSSDSDQTATRGGHIHRNVCTAKSNGNAGVPPATVFVRQVSSSVLHHAVHHNIRLPRWHWPLSVVGTHVPQHGPGDLDTPSAKRYALAATLQLLAMQHTTAVAAAAVSLTIGTCDHQLGPHTVALDRYWSTCSTADIIRHTKQPPGTSMVVSCCKQQARPHTQQGSSPVVRAILSQADEPMRIACHSATQQWHQSQSQSQSTTDSLAARLPKHSKYCYPMHDPSQHVDVHSHSEARYLGKGGTADACSPSPYSLYSNQATAPRTVDIQQGNHPSTESTR
jgi:hypothetical protein